MKRTHAPLATALALALAGTMACTPAPDSGGGTPSGTGGSSSSGTGGSKGTGGTPAGTGGSSSSGTGGTSAGTGGSTSAGTGGSATGTGGSATGTGGAGTGGTSGGTGGATTSPDAGGSDMTQTPGGAFALTVTGFTPGANGRMCYPPGSNNMGNKSPKMDWGPTPMGTKSYVVSTEDKSDMGPHQVICNIMTDVVGLPADIKTMVPPGAESGTRHKEAQGNPWYGPGAGNVRQYEVRVWALAVDKLPGGCKDKAGALAAFKYLKDNMTNKAVVLATDGKSFWGNMTGACQ